MTSTQNHDMTTVQEILAADTGKPPSPPLLEHSPVSFELKDYGVDRYLSQEWVDLEYKKLWPKVWQWACCEEDIPNVGDFHVYEIGDESVIVVRSAPDEVKAFHNSCLHRGRQIKEGQGTTQALACPYHGWTWDLDGQFVKMLCSWDFPQVAGRDLSLPQVRVERWDGFVFINFDADAAPLSEMLDVLPDHFKYFPLDEKFTAINITTVLDANWKVALEAFLETYHAPYTHPTTAEWSGDVNAQYDVWNTTSRLFMPTGVRSPIAGPDTEPELTFEDAVGYFGEALGEEAPTELAPGVHPRAALFEVVSKVMAKMVGADVSGSSHSEVIDAIQYFMFPNWCPWGGITHGFQYRFRPNGRDPHSCVFDLRLRFPLPADGTRPPAAPLRVVERGGAFADIPELLALGALLDDDRRQMLSVQKGLRASKVKQVIFSDYQESRIRHFHEMLDRYLGVDGPDAG